MSHVSADQASSREVVVRCRRWSWRWKIDRGIGVRCTVEDVRMEVRVGVHGRSENVC